jgi:hypothetical protein
MLRLFTFAACLALAAMTLSACTRDKTTPQAAQQTRPAPAPQGESDHGDDDVSREAEIRPAPRISLEPPREVRTQPSGFTPPPEQHDPAAEPFEEEPPAPSIFRSLGRALTRGVSDAVKQGPSDESVSESPVAPEQDEQ